MATTNPDDVGEIQKALNDAASKSAVIWTTFVTLELYLAIAFGSVSHRDLLLESPIKLPLLNVELPLVGFFVVAPILLVIFHFYVFLQLLALAGKAKTHETLLKRAFPVASDRQSLRQRLDSFFVLQFIAGPGEQRTGFSGFSLRLIAWLTLVGAPLLIILQGQLTFLPYHNEGVLWLLRATVIMDLVIVWYFWDRVRSDDDLIIRTVPSIVWLRLGNAASLILAIFSLCLATFPGEKISDNLPGGRLWNYLHAVLFSGAVDEVSGRARGFLSDRLIVTDQNLVDIDKLDKLAISRSFRGRDLRQAVLSRSDLRKADFTGANLSHAQLLGAKLAGANFGCADIQEYRRGPMFAAEPPKLEGPWPDGCAWLDYAILTDVHLEGAVLKGTRLQGAFMPRAQLQGADMQYAQMQGAFMRLANLQATRLIRTQLQAANLELAQLQGAQLMFADATLASFDNASLQGASIDDSALSGASFESTKVWRLRADTSLFRSVRGNFDPRQVPFDQAAFDSWRSSVLAAIQSDPVRDWVSSRISVLNPRPVENAVDGRWAEVNAKALNPQDYRVKLSQLIPDTVCKANPRIVGPLLVGLVENRLLWRQMVQLIKDKNKCGAALSIDSYTMELLRYVSD